MVIENPIKTDNFIELLNLILDVVVQVLVPIIVIAIIYFGAQLIFARGDTAKLTTAKNGIFYVIIGAFIILSSKAIVTLIENTYKEISKTTESVEHYEV